LKIIKKEKKEEKTIEALIFFISNIIENFRPCS